MGLPPCLRAAQERNTMRYFLAMDAHLSALASASQLHEVDHDAYITMKRREHLRQQQVLP
jgi:hypothetical protein